MRNRLAIETAAVAPRAAQEQSGPFWNSLPWLAGCYSVLNFLAHREILRLCIWMRLLNT